jgi:predicted NUDIX family NTP pyrophosphohydrolase
MLPRVQSAGLLLFRKWGASVEVLLGHPGGPFWEKKDLGAWGIPKGLIAADEEPLHAAKREFSEETGYVPRGTFIPLGESNGVESLCTYGRSREIGIRAD